MAKCASSIETARQAFLYGLGDGRPISEAKRLSEVSGLHLHTVLKYLPTWQAEREEVLRESSPLGVRLKITDEVLKKHAEDMAWLRKETEAIRLEAETVDLVVDKLRMVVDNFVLNTDVGDRALAIFEAYCQAALRKKDLRSQFIQMQKQWVQLSGVQQLMDIQLTHDKEIAKGKAKQFVAGTGGPGIVDDTRRRDPVFDVGSPDK